MKNMVHATRAQKTLDLVIYTITNTEDIDIGQPGFLMSGFLDFVPLDIRCLGTTPVQISGVVPQPRPLQQVHRDETL